MEGAQDGRVSFHLLGKEVKFHYLKLYSGSKIHTRNLETLGFLEKTQWNPWKAKSCLLSVSATK